MEDKINIYYKSKRFKADLDGLGSTKIYLLQRISLRYSSSDDFTFLISYLHNNEERNYSFPISKDNIRRTIILPNGINTPEFSIIVTGNITNAFELNEIIVQYKVIPIISANKIDIPPVVGDSPLPLANYILIDKNGNILVDNNGNILTAIERSTGYLD